MVRLMPRIPRPSLNTVPRGVGIHGRLIASLTRFIAGLLLVVTAAACTSQRTVERKTSRRPSDPLLQKFAGNFEYGKDEEGRMRVQSDQRSVFDGQGKGRKESRFNAREYSANQWSGAGQSARVSGFRQADQEFRGVSAREQGSRARWAGEESRAQQQQAMEQGDRNATFDGQFRTQEARVGRQETRVARDTGSAREEGSDYRPALESREKNHRPIMVDPRSGQRRGYSPGEVRSLLGKDG